MNSGNTDIETGPRSPRVKLLGFLARQRVPLGTERKYFRTVAFLDHSIYLSLSTSVHFGRYTVDPVKHTITFQIDRSSVPNLDDTTAVRQYELKGDELSWRVAPRQDGSIPLTTLRRVK